MPFEPSGDRSAQKGYRIGNYIAVKTLTGAHFEEVTCTMSAYTDSLKRSLFLTLLALILSLAISFLMAI
ncbi:hypothetical protein RYO59_001135 [Thermosynechococcaceae cyanobacterium Okahandja]